MPPYIKSFTFSTAFGDLQKLAGNTSWLLFDRVLRLGLGLLLNIWLARVLGPTRYGLLNYAAAFVTLFSVFVTLGIDSVVVRDLVHMPEKAARLLGSVLLMRLTGALVSVTLIAVTIGLTRSNDRQLMGLVLVTALGNLFQIFDTIDLWFQSQLQSRHTVIAKSIAFLTLTVIKLLLLKWNAPLMAFAWAATAEIALGAGGLLVAYQRHYAKLWQWRASFAEIRQLWRGSWPLLLHGLAVFVQARIDQVLLGNLVNEAVVGQYAVALRLVEVLGFLPVIVQTSLAPLVTRAKACGETGYFELLLNLYRLMFVLFLLSAVPLCLGASWLVSKLFGQEYAAAGQWLPWLATRIFFTNFGVAKHLFIINDNLQRYSLVTALAGAAVNVLLNVWLIPRYAALGAIVAMNLSFLVNLFLLDVLYPEARWNLRMMLTGMLTPWRLRVPEGLRALQN